MSINKTLNYLLAKRADVVMCFSAQVTTLSIYLKGAGGAAGDGFPLPRDARINRIDCWDGVLLSSSTGNVSVNQGDRISVYAAINLGNYDVSMRVNGINSALMVPGVASNSTLMVTLHLKMI
jgi:hypothetical protein